MNICQNEPNCSICLASIPNIESNASNLKCEECLRKIDSIPSGFPFKMVNEVKEYECPICLSLIEKATELSCSHLMCKACLEFYENGEVEKHNNKAKFYCSVCQEEYQPKKKKLVKSMDRVIQTSLLVKCLHKECNWTGCIMDYKYHEKDCKYVLINCQHANCKVKVQRQLMDGHLGRCPFRSIQCKHCEEMVIFEQLKEHNDQCPQFLVPCPNKDCLIILKRSEINVHQETQCKFQQIQCPYFEVGCSFKGLRGEMHQHTETYKSNHELLLLTTVKNLKEKSDQGEEKLKEKDIEIEQLKELNTKKVETLNTLKRDFEDLKIQFENVREQLTTKNEINEEHTNDRFKEMNENLTQQSKNVAQFKGEIGNLQTFAERISKLHYNLSELYLRKNNHYSLTLLQEKYDENEEVTKWNDMVKEVDEDDNECNYLETLKSSINQYKETIYSPTYEERLENLCYSTPGVDHYPFMRIGCHEFTESICVKTFLSLKNFNKEIRRNEERSCKTQNDMYTYSYYVGHRLHVLFWTSSEVFLLHSSNEEEKLNLPNGKVVKLDNIFNYKVQDSIVLYLIADL